MAEEETPEVIAPPTDPKRLAAQLVAKGKLTGDQIALEVGVSRRTIVAWKAEPEFAAEVNNLKNAWRATIRTDGLADQDFRLRMLNDRHKRCRAVIEQRAKDPAMQDVPGGKTGILCVTYKMCAGGDGEAATPIPEYRVDVGLLEEMRAIEEQAAIELGQWKTRIVAESGDTAAADVMRRLQAGRDRLAALRKLEPDPSEEAAAVEEGS